MLARLIERPFDDANWIFEIKWDGYRMISRILKHKIELTTRNLNSYTNKFPVIADELKKFRNDVVIDGEIVVLNEKSAPDFQLLQNYLRTGIGRIAYYIFDVLWFDGFNTQQAPLYERKKLLKEIVPKSKFLFYSDHLENEGKKLFKSAQENGLEGIIGKKKNSKYYEGIRTPNWVKIKTEHRQEAIICGFTEPRGSRKHFGSLILGVYEKGELTYIGHTGTGFDFSNLRDIYNMLLKYKQNASPFKKTPKANSHVTWLKPQLVCEVKFSNWTNEGIMRHPVFAGMRSDKKAKEVVRERPAPNG